LRPSIPPILKHRSEGCEQRSLSFRIGGSLQHPDPAYARSVARAPRAATQLPRTNQRKKIATFQLSDSQVLPQRKNQPILAESLSQFNSLGLWDPDAISRLVGFLDSRLRGNEGKLLDLLGRRGLHHFVPFGGSKTATSREFDDAGQE